MTVAKICLSEGKFHHANACICVIQQRDDIQSFLEKKLKKCSISVVLVNYINILSHHTKGSQKLMHFMQKWKRYTVNEYQTI